MSCIAIWYVPKDKESRPLCVTESHFNLWKFKKEKGVENQLLDIGLMFEEGTDINALKIFLPCNVTSVTDLGVEFDTNTVQAVFNESWYSKDSADKSNIEVKDFQEVEKFVVNIFDKKDIKVASEFGGTLIELSFNEKLTKKTYFRIRIGPCTFDGITSEKKPSNSWLESAFQVTETVDFHVNVERQLTDELLRAKNKEGVIKFSKTHVFVMRPDWYDYLFSYPEPNDARMLENEKWLKYLRLTDFNDPTLAYHWKQKGEIRISEKEGKTAELKEPLADISVFVKFRYLKTSKQIIFAFIGIVLALGVFGNWIYAILGAIVHDVKCLIQNLLN